MENKHIHRLTENFPEEMQNKTAVVLAIADDYSYMDTELIDSIKISVSAYLHNAKN